MEQSEKLKSRSDISGENKWRLESIYESDEAWEAEFARAQDTSIVASFAGKLTSAASLKAALDACTEASRVSERLYVYAHMRRDEDNSNAKYQAMTDRALQLSTELETATAYLQPDILAIPQATLREYMKLPEFAVYAHLLDNMDRERAHTLSEKEERLLAMAGEVLDAPQNIFRMFDHADLTFSEIENESGHKVELTHGNFISFMESNDRRVRKDAFEALYSSYKSFENTLGASYSASVKADVFVAKARGYDSALHMALSEDNVPVEVYDSLIDAVHEKLPQLHRYTELRKRALGVDELHMYDLYTPIVPDVEIRAELAEAKSLVKAGLAVLGEDYTKLLDEAYTCGWMDIYENKGKTSGAYCWGVYGSHPCVLLNFHPTLDNAFTIAHELGHAMHSYYSDASQPYVNAQYKIFVAEVASTVNEVLLMRHLLLKETDKLKRMYLLNQFLDQFRTTLFRQVMFAEFEKRSHALCESGEALTSERLSAEYKALNRLYYGDAMVLDDEIAMEWARIPHFYTAFYVYKYATGFSAAVAIADEILRTGDASDYKAFLKSGGSDYPIELLKLAHVDLSTPTPVSSALSGAFANTLGELEKLLEV